MSNTSTRTKKFLVGVKRAGGSTVLYRRAQYLDSPGHYVADALDASHYEHGEAVTICRELQAAANSAPGVRRSGGRVHPCEVRLAFGSDANPVGEVMLFELEIGTALVAPPLSVGQ